MSTILPTGNSLPHLPPMLGGRGGHARVSNLLSQVRGLAQSTGAQAQRAAEATGRSQHTLDLIVAGIDRAAQAAAAGPVEGPNYEVTAVSPDVARHALANVHVPPGSATDVNVTVTASAQLGGLYLSMGSLTLNTAANSGFQFEITGGIGSTEFTFVSGTSLANIADAINATSFETGVRAVQSGTGIRLESRGYGATQFVSVRVIEDGGLDARAHRLKNDDFYQASPGSSQALSSGSEHADYGQDIEARVNGQITQTRGTDIWFEFPQFIGRLTLGVGPSIGGVNAQNIGTMLAFRIIGNESAPQSNPGGSALGETYG